MRRFESIIHTAIIGRIGYSRMDLHVLYPVLSHEWYVWALLAAGRARAVRQ